MAVITLEDLLNSPAMEHYGIKGMRWGVRRKRGPDGTVGSSEDAAKALTTAKTIKKHGTSAVSNDDLRALVNRINLEKDYLRATAEKSRVEKGQAVVGRMLSLGKTTNDVLKFTTSPAGKLVVEAMGAQNSKAVKAINRAVGVDQAVKGKKGKKKKK
jgi:hypothetical protein